MAQADGTSLELDIQELPIARLRHLEVNARYMTAEQQSRLTENLKRDGALTSYPLVWLMQDEDGTPTEEPPVYEIVSGNHRVTSAREAGFTDIPCIVISNWISPNRRVELQLSHNAISGQDDLSVLRELYESLELGGKVYSGLTDDAFKDLADLSLTSFSVEAPEYQEITLQFLPEDAEQFEAMLKRVTKVKAPIVHVAQLETFDKLFDAIVRAKEALNVQNSAIAVATVVELALERLDQLEAEADQKAEPVETAKKTKGPKAGERVN